MHLCKADEATFSCHPHSSPPVAARRPACRQTGRQTWSNATAPPTRPPPPLAAVSPSSHPAPCDKAPSPGCACSCVPSCACVCSTAPSRVRRRRSHAAPRALRTPGPDLTTRPPSALAASSAERRGGADPCLPSTLGRQPLPLVCACSPCSSSCVLVEPLWAQTICAPDALRGQHSANLLSARGGGKCTVKPHYSGHRAARFIYTQESHSKRTGKPLTLR